MANSTPPAQGAPRLSGGFAAFALALLAANALIVAHYPAWTGQPVPEWPLAFDLLLLLPATYVAVHWKQGRQVVWRTLALAGLGVLVGSLILPASAKHAWLLLEMLRNLGLAVLLLAQLAATGWIAWQWWRRPAQEHPEQALRRAIAARFGDAGWTRWLQFEGRLWLYGLARRPSTLAFRGERHFHVGRQGMNAANQQGFLWLVAMEIPIAHGLIALFDPTIAAIVTGLSVYGWIFLRAEYRATLERPISVDARGLHLRYGVVTDLYLDWSQIAAATAWRGPARRGRNCLRLIGMGEANLVLELQPDTLLPGGWGGRRIERIVLGVDDPAGLLAAIGEHCARPLQGRP